MQGPAGTSAARAGPRNLLSNKGRAWTKIQRTGPGRAVKFRPVHCIPLVTSVRTVCCLDRHGLLDAKRVDDLQNRVLDALRDHCTYNAATQRQLFARAIGLLPQLRTVSRLGVDRLRALKYQGSAEQPAGITPVSPELFAATLACSGPALQSPF